MFLEPPQHSLKEIAAAVLKLSDYYIENPEAQTPWHENFCQLAYRYYYLPLNFIRANLVIERGDLASFFEDLEHFIDWGAGPGTLSLAFAGSALKKQIKSQLLFDISGTVLKVFSDLHQQLINPKSQTQLNLAAFNNSEKTCLGFSYSLTELNELPKGWNRFEALVILEPSTQQDARRLQELRSELIRSGYSIWAPCTHQNDCPLLSHSKHDWCHDRTKVNAPDWFHELEKLLPMRNQNVTVSYLLARKKNPSPKMSQLARITGDQLEEKGKTRQLVCKGPQREFLCWMHKSSTVQPLERGSLIETPENFESKSNEIRLSEACRIVTEKF